MTRRPTTEDDPLARLVGRVVTVDLPKLETAHGRLLAVGEFLVLDDDGRTTVVPRRRVEAIRCHVEVGHVVA